MKKCAVVILNFNGKHYLEKFLPGVIKYSSEFADVVVIDNASADNSIPFLEEIFPQVNVIRLEKNHGFAGGYNEGLERLEHEFFLLLNSDVEVTQGWLQPLLEMMSQNKEIGSVQPKILSFKQKSRFEHAGAAGGLMDKFGYPFCRGRILNETEEDKGQYDQNIPVFWTSGACMLIRAKLFKELKGFDADFFAHMEEIDLCWRLQKKGFKCMYNYASRVYHVGGGTLDMENPFKVYLNFRNSLFTLTKNLPLSKLIWLLPFRFFLDGIAGLKFITEGKFKACMAIIKAHFSYYYSFFRTWRKRKIIPNNRIKLFPKSIIYSFYIKRIKEYRNLEA